MPEELITIERDSLTDPTVQQLADWFYDDWWQYKRAFRQLEVAAHNRIEAPAISDLYDQQEQELIEATAILRQTAIKSLERMECLPEERLRELRLDERLTLRLTLGQIRKDVKREEKIAARQNELTELRAKTKARGRDDDRSR